MEKVDSAHKSLTIKATRRAKDSTSAEDLTENTQLDYIVGKTEKD
jgi:hypothetical protein